MNRFKLQIPQIIIIIFLLIMVAMVIYLKIPLPKMITDSLIKLVMNGVLVVSLIPMLNAGVGMNFGLPIGVCAGLLGMCLSINFKFTGMNGFFMSIVFSMHIGGFFGNVYSKVFNRVKGREEIVATFVGFSFIPLMFFLDTSTFH
jgi:simple sugar transport system permease protein